VARDGQGIGELWHHLQTHFQRITTSGMLLRRREVRLQQELRAAIEAAVQTTVLQPILSSAAYRVAQSQVLQRQRDPLSAAHALLPDHTGMPAACAGPG
jgi:putative protein kinase ArgK-like GTPase of G3E family